MLTSDFDYLLPKELIAQTSVQPRDHSRLMVVHKNKKTIEHRHFYDIVDYLQPGDVIVWNNSKVFKARLYGKLVSANDDGLLEHAREVEIFLVRPMENNGVWQILAKPGKHVRMGTRIQLGKTLNEFYCDVMVKEPTGTLLVQFPGDEEMVRTFANQFGHIPIPPYVKDEPHELEMYQTVYAKHEGSVAAPTAGFHFTPELIEKLKKKGIDFVEVTLHVGLGTFLPVKAERVEDHTMHSEWIEVSQEAADHINTAKTAGRRIVAVGTTTVRTLEGLAQMKQFADGKLNAYHGELNTFILPGFHFQIIDVMITNFHLPKSTLLMLVSAFVEDPGFILDCYKKAVAEQYRFFSFGDAMVIV